MKKIKWTYDLVKNEALKFNSSSEFKKGNPKAYDYACRHNILGDFFSNVQKFWSLDEIKKEASKYKTKNEFKIGSNCAYQAALRKNIIDELFENTNAIWNEESVREEASKYKNKSEFKKNCVGAYGYALRHNLIDDLFCNTYTYWNDESVIEFAKKCKTKKDFYQNSGAYGYATRHNLLNTFTWLMLECDELKRCIYAYTDEKNKVAYIGLTVNKEERHISHSTGFFRGKKQKSPVFEYFMSIKEEVPEPIYLEDNLSLIEAQEKENYYIKKFEENGYKILNKAKTGIGIGSVGYRHKWSFERLKEEASKYKTKTELYLNNRGAYDYAISNNFIDDLYDNVKNVWNEDKVKEEASKYKNRYSFLKNCKGGYCYAERHNMLDDLFGKTNHWDEESVRNEAKKYKNMFEFQKNSSGAYSFAYRNGFLNELFPKNNKNYENKNNN